MIGHSLSDLLAHLPVWPVWGLDLAVQQEVLLGSHVVEEDIVLHADAQLLTNGVQVHLHVFAIHLYGARWGGEEASQERPRNSKIIW